MANFLAHFSQMAEDGEGDEGEAEIEFDELDPAAQMRKLFDVCVETQKLVLRVVARPLANNAIAASSTQLSADGWVPRWKTLGPSLRGFMIRRMIERVAARSNLVGLTSDLAFVDLGASFLRSIQLCEVQSDEKVIASLKKGFDNSLTALRRAMGLLYVFVAVLCSASDNVVFSYGNGLFAYAVQADPKARDREALKALIAKFVADAQFAELRADSVTDLVSIGVNMMDWELDIRDESCAHFDPNLIGCYRARAGDAPHRLHDLGAALRLLFRDPIQFDKLFEGAMKLSLVPIFAQSCSARECTRNVRKVQLSVCILFSYLFLMCVGGQ